MEQPQKLMTTKEAGQYLRLSPVTLIKQRSLQLGPKYYKLPNGSIRYYPADLDEYVKENQ